MCKTSVDLLTLLTYWSTFPTWSYTILILTFSTRVHKGFFLITWILAIPVLLFCGLHNCSTAVYYSKLSLTVTFSWNLSWFSPRRNKLSFFGSSPKPPIFSVVSSPPSFLRTCVISLMSPTHGLELNKYLFIEWMKYRKYMFCLHTAW